VIVVVVMLDVVAVVVAVDVLLVTVTVLLVVVTTAQLPRTHVPFIAPTLHCVPSVSAGPAKQTLLAHIPDDTHGPALQSTPELCPTHDITATTLLVLLLSNGELVDMIC
jgi:hypothetical protein